MSNPKGKHSAGGADQDSDPGAKVDLSQLDESPGQLSPGSVPTAGAHGQWDPSQDPAFLRILQSDFDTAYRAARSGDGQPYPFEIPGPDRSPPALGSSSAAPTHHPVSYTGDFATTEYPNCFRNFASDAPDASYFQRSGSQSTLAAHQGRFDVVHSPQNFRRSVPEYPSAYSPKHAGGHPSSHSDYKGKGKGRGYQNYQGYNKGKHGKGKGKGKHDYQNNKGKGNYKGSRAQNDPQWRMQQIASGPASIQQLPMHLTLEEIRVANPDMPTWLHQIAAPQAPLFAFRIQKLVLRQFFRSQDKVAEVEAARWGVLLHDGIFLVCRWDDVQQLLNFCRTLERSRHSVKARLRVLPTPQIERILTQETRERLLTTLNQINETEQQRHEMMAYFHETALAEERNLPIPRELARSNC